MPLNIVEVVGTLDELDVLDLDGECPWPHEPIYGADNVFDIAWDEVKSSLSKDRGDNIVERAKVTTTQ